MNAHSLSTNAAYDAALQKRRAFACRPRFPCSSEPQRVLGEALLIRLKLLPTDVADMNIRNHELPFRPGDLGRAVLAVWQMAGADATIDECAGIAGIMQYLEDSRMRGPHPMQLALVQALANAAGEPEASSGNSFAVCIADPVRSKVSKTRRIAACTSASGSRIRTPSSR